MDRMVVDVVVSDKLRTVVGMVEGTVVGEAGIELDARLSDADETGMTLGEAVGESEAVTDGVAETEFTDQLDTGVLVGRPS